MERKQKGSVLESILEGGDCDDSNIHRISNRKYVEENVRLYESNLAEHGSDDFVDFFGKKLESLKWHVCNVCHTTNLGFTKRCWCLKTYLIKSRLVLIGSCPDVLNKLSIVEQLLIARVHGSWDKGVLVSTIRLVFCV